MEKLVGVDLTQNKVLVDVNDENGFNMYYTLVDISYENLFDGVATSFSFEDMEYEKRQNENITFITLKEFLEILNEKLNRRE